MNNPFLFRKVGSEASSKIDAIRSEFAIIHNLIVGLVPSCRERSIALTELEASCMWAIKAASVTDPASVPVE